MTNCLGHSEFEKPTQAIRWLLEFEAVFHARGHGKRHYLKLACQGKGSETTEENEEEGNKECSGS